MPLRETFWNIPHWAEYSNYILGFLTIVIFAFGVWRRTRVWMKGKPAQRLDHPVERILGVVQHGILQQRTESQPYPGLMHRTIFWGMAFLFAGTALATLDWDVTRLLFSFQFLTGVIYVTYELVLDLFGLALLFGLGMAAYRRYAVHPKRLANALSARYGRDDAYALIVLAVIALTGYVIEGLRIAVQQPSWQHWSPVGFALAGLFTPLGESANRSLHVAVWMFHMLVVFGFIAAIPYTKFFHIITSPMNIFLRKLEPAGALEPIRNIEEAETFGAGKIEDWTWKRLLDFDACTRCGRCQDVCPATATGKPLSPQNIIVKLGGYLHETPLATGKKDAALRAMHGEVITADELWDCTTCAACVQVCPVFIDQLGAIVEMRRYLTMSEGNVSRNLNMALTGMEQNGNPYGLGRAQRADWAKGLDVKTMAETSGEVDILYWVGCAAAYDDRNKRVARAFVKVLQAAGISFAILGSEESCTGDSARRAGNEYLFQMLAQENIETLRRYKVKRIVTACPHCFHTIKDEYPQFGGSYEVMHHSQFIADLLAQGKLKLSEETGAAGLTYHEPCYLGRHNNVYQPARDVIGEATGRPVIEMARHHANSFCCGAGGARSWMEENRGTRINQNRAAEAIASGASALAVACPFCMGMMADGLKAKAAEGSRQMEIKDIAEVVAERIAA
jgi:Fe-S oxidoreductase